MAMEIVSDPSLLFLDEPTGRLVRRRRAHRRGAQRPGEARRQRRRRAAPAELPDLPQFHVLRGRRRPGGLAGRGLERAARRPGLQLPPYANPADFYLELIRGAAVVVPDRRRAGTTAGPGGKRAGAGSQRARRRARPRRSTSRASGASGGA